MRQLDPKPPPPPPYSKEDNKSKSMADDANDAPSAPASSAAASSTLAPSSANTSGPAQNSHVRSLNLHRKHYTNLLNQTPHVSDPLMNNIATFYYDPNLHYERERNREANLRFERDREREREAANLQYGRETFKQIVCLCFCMSVFAVVVIAILGSWFLATWNSPSV